MTMVDPKKPKMLGDEQEREVREANPVKLYGHSDAALGYSRHRCDAPKSGVPMLDGKAGRRRK